MKVQKNGKISKFALVLCGAAIILLALIWARMLFLPQREAVVSSPEGEARVRLAFYEAGSGKDLSGVRIVVPETGQNGVYGSGDYLFIRKDLSEITLLIYKEDYCDTAVFHLPIKKGSVQTARYALYADDGSLPYVVYCEAPAAEVVASLLSAWRK